MKATTLGELVEFLPSRPIASDGDTAVVAITSGCLQPDGFDPSRARPNRMRSGDVEASLVEPGEVLVSRSNTEEFVGRAAMATEDARGMVTSDLVFRLRPTTGVDSQYLAYALVSLQLGGWWQTRSSGASSTMKKITRSQVAALPIGLPSLQVQRQVAGTAASRLRAIEHLRAACTEQGALVDSLRERAFARAFGGILPLASTTNRDSPPPGWTWARLTSLSRLESGHTPSRSRPDWWGGDIPWVQLADIRAVDGRVIESTQEMTNPEGIAHSAARILPADTVVMSRTASVGFVARLGRPMATSQDFVNWVCGPELAPEFLMHLLIRARHYVRSLSAGAIHKTVYYPTVKDFYVCVPGIAQQRRLATQLHDDLATIDRMATATGRRLEAIESLPAVLLRQAFEEVAAR